MKKSHHIPSVPLIQPTARPLFSQQYQKQNAWETLGNNVSCYKCAAPWPILDVVPMPYRTDECHKTTEPTKPSIMETQTATLCAVSVMTALSPFKRWHEPDELEYFFTYTVDIQVYTLTVARNTATSRKKAQNQIMLMVNHQHKCRLD